MYGETKLCSISEAPFHVQKIMTIRPLAAAGEVVGYTWMDGKSERITEHYYGCFFGQDGFP